MKILVHAYNEMIQMQNCTPVNVNNVCSRAVSACFLALLKWGQIIFYCKVTCHWSVNTQYWEKLLRRYSSHSSKEPVSQSLCMFLLSIILNTQEWFIRKNHLLWLTSDWKWFSDQDWQHSLHHKSLHPFYTHLKDIASLLLPSLFFYLSRWKAEESTIACW